MFAVKVMKIFRTHSLLVVLFDFSAHTKTTVKLFLRKKKRERRRGKEKKMEKRTWYIIHYLRTPKRLQNVI